MSRKTLASALLVLLLAAGLCYLQLRSSKGERQRARPLRTLSRAKIRQVAITNQGTKVVLREEQGSWRLTQPRAEPADDAAVRALLDKLTSLELGELVTTMPSKQAEYHVDAQTGTHVVVSGATASLLDFYLGKTIDGFTMLRAADSVEIYQAVGALEYVFARELKNWRERSILDFPQQDARRLTVITSEPNGGGTIVLRRPSAEAPWEVERSSVPIPRLDGALVSNLLSTLHSLSAFDFADGISTAQAGLGRPDAQLLVGLRDHQELSVLIKHREDEDYYVARRGTPQLFVIKRYSAENLLWRPIDFRDKSVLSFQPEQATRLSLRRPKEQRHVTLVRKGEDWFADGTRLADPRKVDLVRSAIEALADLRAEGFAHHSAKEYGLGEPDWIVELQLKDHSRFRLAIGASEQDALLGLSRAGSPEVFTFCRATLERFLLDPQLFKSP